MSTADVDVSGGRRAVPLTSPTGLQKQSTNPHSTRQLLHVEEGLLDLFAEVMLGLSEASRQDSYRNSRIADREPSRREGDVDQEAQLVVRSINEVTESVQKPIETSGEFLHSSITEKDQQQVEPVASSIVADDRIHHSASGGEAKEPDRQAAVQNSATQGSESDARTFRSEKASDPQRPFDRDPVEPFGNTICDGDHVGAPRSEEVDPLPSQRQQRRLQPHSAPRREGLVDAPTAKQVDHSIGTSSTPESGRPVFVKLEPAANIVESTLAASQSSAALGSGAAVHPAPRVSTSNDSASMRTAMSRLETGKPATTGVVTNGENQPSSVATSASNHSGMNRRSEVLARVKLISRVSKAFQHLGREGGLVRLRLAPAELGTVQVEMRLGQNRVRARIVTETEAATAALREHLPDLRARLESLGMRVERFDVETESSQQGTSSDGSDSRRWQSPGERPGTLEEGFTPRSGHPGSGESDFLASSGPQVIGPRHGNSGVDLRV